MNNLIAVLKALSNEKRLKILQWLKEPRKHFSSSHCDVGKEGVCRFDRRKVRLISIDSFPISDVITTPA